MKFIDEFRDKDLVQDLARRLAALARRPRHHHGGLRHPHHGRGPLRPEVPSAPRGAAHFRARLPGVRHRPVGPGRLPGPGDRTRRGPRLLRRHAPGPRHPHLPGRPAGPGRRRCGWSTPPWTRWNWPGKPRRNRWSSSGWASKPPCPPPPWPSRPRPTTAWIISRSSASTRPCPRPCRPCWPAARSGFPGSSAPATSPPSSAPRPTILSPRNSASPARSPALNPWTCCWG